MTTRDKVLALESKVNSYEKVMRILSVIGYSDFKSYTEWVCMGYDVDFLKEIAEERMNTFINAVNKGEEAVIELLTPEGEEFVIIDNKLYSRKVA